MVVFKSECTVDKINFWTKFINLYYRSTGGEVRCCDTDGCNTGSFTDGIYPSVTEVSIDLRMPINDVFLIFGYFHYSPL